MILYNLQDKKDYEVALKRTAGEEPAQCPVCSDDRKKKSLKCFSFNHDKNLGRCSHCNSSFIPKREFEPKKEYVRPPVWSNETALSNNLVKWFEKRGIKQKTLEDFKIGEGLEYMPQESKEMNCIKFPYFRNKELINIKYRTGNKLFKLHKDAELIFFNLDAIKNTKRVIIVEGECFYPEAQILTKNGWVCFNQWNGEDVAQYKEGNIEFITPNALIKKEYNGKLIEYENSQKFYSLTTPGHNLVVSTKDGNHIKKIKASDLKSNAIDFIPRTAIHNGNGINLTDLEIRLCIAVSADFTLRKEGDIYGCVKKERKRERLCEILDGLKLPYSCNKDNRDHYSFFIRRHDAPKYLFKLFPIEWICQSTLEQKKLIINEILYWDGNSVPNRKQIEYSSKEIHNATFIQTVSSLIGYCATIIPRKNQFGSWYKVSILFKKQFTSTQAICQNKKEIEYNGLVYCLNVPSGMLLVRQNNCISVSGNCDAMIVSQNGYPDVVSVPNGAGLNKINLSFLDNCIEYFIDKEEILIGTDDDAPGRNLCEQLAERLGKERCYKIQWADKKDANDCFLTYGVQGIIDSINNKKEFPLEGVFTIDDFEDEINDIYDHGLPKGAKTMMGELNKLIKFHKGYFTTITGTPGAGKTKMLDQIILQLGVVNDWKVAYFSPESKPTSLHISNLCCALIGKKWWAKKEEEHLRITPEQLKLAKAYLKDRVHFIEPEKDYTLDSILNTVKGLIVRKGIDCFVIDAWNTLEHKFSGNETQYINECLGKISAFCKLHTVHGFIVAHPTKIPKQKNSQEFEVPNLYSISGSANFYNRTDVGLCIYRNYTEECTYVYVQKVKFQPYWGSTGHCRFKYDTETGRYNEFFGGAMEPTFDKTSWIHSMKPGQPKQETGIIINNEETPF